jgi:hypothetical protein
MLSLLLPLTLFFQTPTAPLGRIRTGKLLAVSPTSETLTLLEGDGKAHTYRLSEQTLYRKRRIPALLQDFKAGEEVFLRMRLNRDATAIDLLALFDTPSFRWLQSLRSQIIYATLTEIQEESVTVQYQGQSVRYVIDHKTRWRRKNREVSQSSFQKGDRVWIAPEVIVGADILTRCVADTKEGLGSARRSPFYNLRGNLISYRPEENHLTLRLKTGEERTFSFPAPLELRQRAKPISEETLRAAMPNRFPVAVRMQRSPSGDYATRITIEKTERRRKPKP